jgi:hypothetical protein
VEEIKSATGGHFFYASMEFPKKLELIALWENRTESVDHVLHRSNVVPGPLQHTRSHKTAAVMRQLLASTVQWCLPPAGFVKCLGCSLL